MKELNFEFEAISIKVNKPLCLGGLVVMQACSDPENLINRTHVNLAADRAGQSVKGRFKIIWGKNASLRMQPLFFTQAINKPAPKFVCIKNAVQITSPDGSAIFHHYTGW